MPTCSSVISESSAIEAPTIKNVADEISAGTSIFVAVNDPPPFKQILLPSVITL